MTSVVNSTGTTGFLSTLSLRRATLVVTAFPGSADISIHALLAESDLNRPPPLTSRANFYPRSPCGERRGVLYGCYGLRISIHALLAESDCFVRTMNALSGLFLSTLSLRRATGRAPSPPRRYFYPRSPCGERQVSVIVPSGSLYFYPRSPCGERLHEIRNALAGFSISIHALLAESDPLKATKNSSFHEFLSTLSLRRATKRWFLVL